MHSKRVWKVHHMHNEAFGKQGRLPRRSKMRGRAGKEDWLGFLWWLRGGPMWGFSCVVSPSCWHQSKNCLTFFFNPLAHMWGRRRRMNEVLKLSAIKHQKMALGSLHSFPIKSCFSYIDIIIDCKTYSYLGIYYVSILFTYIISLNSHNPES